MIISKNQMVILTFGTTDLDSVASDAWTVFAVGQAGTGSTFQNGGGRGSAFVGKAGGNGRIWYFLFWGSYP